MKNGFKFLSLGMLVMAFYAVSATSIFAQATLEDCTKIYQVLLDNRKGPEVQKFRTAIAAGKEYLEKCSTLEGQETVKDYVTKQIPSLETKIKEGEIAGKEKAFNDALKAKNNPGIIAAAKELIAINRPYSLDLMLDIASIGFDSASGNPANDSFNNDSLTYAKMALQNLESGKTSGNADKYGFYVEYKTPTCGDGKLNATGWMNYSIGFITYTRLKQTKDALPYLYKSTQTGCETKGFAEAYRLIGAWYLDEVIKLNNDYAAKTKANGDKENDETLAILAMIKGYAERAADAYARAYKIANAPGSKSPAAYKDGLLKRVNEMHQIRFGDPTKVNAYIAEVSNKPFVDPTTPVTPVVETAPATGTPTTSSSNLSGSGTDSAEAGNTTARTTSAGTPTTKASTTTKKPAAKKPAPKKKGTR